MTFFWPHYEWLDEIFAENAPLGFQSPALTSLVSQIGETADPDTRGRIYRELIAYFQDQVPITFVGPIAWTVITHRRLRGLSSPWRTNPLPYMAELWLANDP